ncbi:MAG TPA: serine/threonine-protein kinase, partial [Candidatus Angelobacter sp.]
MTTSAKPDYPDVPDTPREQAVAEALSAFLDRQAQGEELDIEVFCRENAGLLPELRSELETLAGITAVLEPGSPAAPVSSTVESNLPERLSGHKILSEIGSGGMGCVLLAQDERLNRKVAIKVLAPRYWPDALLASRFMQEARAMAQLSHPHIANIFNLGASGEPPHFVMEYIQGVPLTEAAHALHLPQRMELFSKVALAVDFLHRHGIIHRDLKPANILVGTDLQPKVLDFGLALRMEASEHLT